MASIGNQGSAPSPSEYTLFNAMLHNSFRTFESNIVTQSPTATSCTKGALLTGIGEIASRFFKDIKTSSNLDVTDKASTFVIARFGADVNEDDITGLDLDVIRSFLNDKSQHAELMCITKIIGIAEKVQQKIKGTTIADPTVAKSLQHNSKLVDEIIHWGKKRIAELTKQ